MTESSRPKRSGRTALITLAMADPTGAGKMAASFAGALTRRGWRVVVAAGPGPAHSQGTLARMLMEAGAETKELDRLVAPTVASWKQLRRIARDVRPDVVIGFMQRDRPIAVTLARRLGVPAVLHVGNQHVFWGPPPVRAAKKLLYRATVPRFVTRAVCTSEAVAREMIELGTPADRTVVLPNGVTATDAPLVAAAARMRMRSALGARESGDLLVMVGRLDPQKGQDVLLDAMRQVVDRMSDVHLALIGEPTSGANNERSRAFAASLREQVQRLGLEGNVTFGGWRNDVQQLLSVADVYVHSARWEGPALCLSILEAMAAERPVVITDCSGWPEGFEQGVEGRVARTGSSDALARELLAVLALPAEARARMGAAARTLVRTRYDAYELEGTFVDIVEELTAT